MTLLKDSTDFVSMHCRDACSASHELLASSLIYFQAEVQCRRESAAVRKGVVSSRRPPAWRGDPTKSPKSLADALLLSLFSVFTYRPSTHRNIALLTGTGKGYWFYDMGEILVFPALQYYLVLIAFAACLLLRESSLRSEAH